MVADRIYGVSHSNKISKCVLCRGAEAGAVSTAWLWVGGVRSHTN